MKTSDVVARLYTWLLRLYPRDFHHGFACDMCADYRDGYAAARRVGIKGSMSFIVRSYWDLAGSLLSQWLETDAFIVWRVSVLVAISIWAAALAVAAFEWRHGPSSPSFVLQLAIALVAGSTLTIGIALRHHTDHGSGYPPPLAEGELRRGLLAKARLPPARDGGKPEHYVGTFRRHVGNTSASGRRRRAAQASSTGRLHATSSCLPCLPITRSSTVAGATDGLVGPEAGEYRIRLEHEAGSKPDS